MTKNAGLVCFGISVSLLPAALNAQPSAPTHLSIDAHVQSMTLPQEFRVQRFTAGLYRVAAASADPQGIAEEVFDVPSSIAVSSSSIPAGGAIDMKYSAYGQGISPPLQWSSLPSGTQSVVLMMEDPDAGSPPFVHWTIINLPPSLGALPANVGKEFTTLREQGARQGSNSKRERGYFGPRPPAGDPPHHYHFQIFALNTKLDLPDGFDRHALLQAMRGHVLAKGELIGMFQAPR